MKTPSFVNREKELKQLIKSRQNNLRHAPAGTLTVTTIRGKTRFYRSQPGGKGLGTYLGKKDLKLVQRLAQKSYDQKVLKVAERELHAWELLAAHFPDMTAEEVYDALSPARQKYVIPIRPTDEAFQKQWESVTYEPGCFRSDVPEYYTDRGERVRSKSEQLIGSYDYLSLIRDYSEWLQVLIANCQRTGIIQNTSAPPDLLELQYDIATAVLFAWTVSEGEFDLIDEVRRRFLILLQVKTVTDVGT